MTSFNLFGFISETVNNQLHQNDPIVYVENNVSLALCLKLSLDDFCDWMKYS